MQRSPDGKFSDDDQSPATRTGSSGILDVTQFLSESERETAQYRSVAPAPLYRSINTLQIGSAAQGADPALLPVPRQAAGWKAEQYAAPSVPLPKHKGHMGQLPSGMDAPPGAGKPALGNLAPGLDAPPGARSKFHGPKDMYMPTEEVNPMFNSKEGQGLPKLKVPYARNTSVVSTADGKAILSGFGELLETLPDCDFTIKTRNYKCAGDFFWQERLCKFMVQLFRTPEEHMHPNATLIEFQRRSGDVFAFQHIYRFLVDGLAARDLVQFSATDMDRAMLPRPMQALAMPAFGDEDEDDEICGEECGYLDFSKDEGVVQNLVQMCRSIYLEPRREATAVLARGSRSKKNARILCATPQIAPVMIQILHEVNDLQVTRNTALILTNMIRCATEIRQTGLKSKMVKTMCDVFSRWSSNSKQGSKLVSVQIGAALKLVAEKSGRGARFTKDQKVLSYLKQVATTSPISEAKALADQVYRMIQER